MQKLLLFFLFFSLTSHATEGNDANHTKAQNQLTQSEASQNKIIDDTTTDDAAQSNQDETIDEEAIAQLLAEDTVIEEEPSHWAPEIELGYQSRKGNDDTQALNLRVSLDYTKGKIRHSGEVKIYQENEDGEEEENEQRYDLQSDYKINPKTYVYGSFKGIDSKYSSYFRDYTFSTGLGYQIYNTETIQLETEFGPGYRVQHPNTDEIDDDDLIFPDNVQEAILRANVSASWKPTKNLSLEMNTTMVSGDSNTRLGTEFNIINHINDFIALKLSHNLDYLSRVPEHLDKTDTTFKINILFQFQ